jgi:hypothetical protein
VQVQDDRLYVCGSLVFVGECRQRWLLFGTDEALAVLSLFGFPLFGSLPLFVVGASDKEGKSIKNNGPAEEGSQTGTRKAKKRLASNATATNTAALWPLEKERERQKKKRWR